MRQSIESQENVRCALNHFFAADCEELDELSKVNGWQTAYQQLGAGDLSVQFDLALSPRLVLSDKLNSKRMLNIATTPPDHKVVIVPLGSDDNGSLFGADVSSGCIGLVNDRTDVFYKAPANLRMLVATIPMELLTRTVESAALQPSAEKAIFETSVLNIGETAVLDLARKIRQMMNHIGSTSRPDAAQNSLQEFEEQLVSSLSYTLASPQQSRLGSRGRVNRRKHLARALELINTHLTEPLGITTLAEQTCTSQRTLEAAFTENLGITPVKYIRTQRLNAVRSRLLRAQPEDSVTHVAHAYGFSHLSHFSREYHSLFSELPSDTLLRSK